MTKNDSLREEDARIVEALRFGGLSVASVYDLVNTKRKHPAAIPILVKLLPTVTNDKIKEGIARALTVKEAQPFAGALVREFETMRTDSKGDEYAKWAIGNALAVATTEDVLEDVIRLLHDKKHGWTRAMLPLGLANTKARREVAVAALLKSLEDDQIVCQASTALAKLKASEAILPLKSLLKHANVDVRKAAAKALRRIEKSNGHGRGKQDER